MAIEFNCPYCTAAIRVADNAAGKVGRCPKCETRLRVPSPQPPDETSSIEPPPEPPPATDPPAIEPPAPTEPPPAAEPQATTEPPPSVPPPRRGGGPPPRRPLPPPPPAPNADEPVVPVPEIPEPQPEFPGLIIDATDAVEPIHQRVARGRQRNWAALLVPLVCGGILLAVGVGYWWMNRETMTGELTAERLPHDTTVSAVIQRFVPDVSTEVWQAAQVGLGEDPVIVQSELMVVAFRGSRRGLEVSLSAGPETDLVRVDVRRNRMLNQFCVDHNQQLDEAWERELKDASTHFLDDWNNAATSGMLMGNGQQYRDSVGLNALTRGLGYHSVAVVGNRLYPCVYEDAEFRLYFVVPHGVDEFVVTERDFPDRPSIFPGEYRFTVHVAPPPPEPAPEETEPTDEPDDSTGEESDMSMDPATPGETPANDPDSNSNQR